jgi:hypothetical protein
LPVREPANVDEAVVPLCVNGDGVCPSCDASLPTLSDMTRPAEPESTSGWRLEALIALTVLIAVTCLIYYEIVFMGRTILSLQVPGVMGWGGPYGYDKPFRPDFYHLDQGAPTFAFEALTRKVAREFTAGRFPLWNDNQAFGMPLLADAVSGALSPLHWPLLVNGSALAWDLYYLIRIIVGGMAAYVFARYVGLSIVACLFFAIAYVFSGHFILMVNNHWLEAYFLLPVILIGTEMTLGTRPRVGFALIAVAVGLALLVGMPEVSLAVLLLAAAWGGYRLLGLARESGLGREGLRSAALLVWAWLIGIAFAMPLLIPLFEFVRHSSSMVTVRESYGLAHAPLADIVIWLMPLLKGFPLYPTINSVSTYVGATVIVLALSALFPVRTKLYRFLVPFAALAAGVLLAKSFGVPIINELGRLPGLDVTHISKWFGPVIGFLVALLASVGVHHLAIGRGQRARAIATLLLFICVLLVSLWLNWSVVTNGSERLLVFSVGVTCLLALATWLTIYYLPARPFLRPEIVCCALVTLELFMLAPHDVYQDRYERFEQAPYISFLKSQPAESSFRIFGADFLLHPNFASVFELHDIRVLNALYVDRFWMYIQQFVSPEITDRFVGVPTSAESEKEALIRNNPWFDLTGVRYVLTAPGSSTAQSLGGSIVDTLYAGNQAIVKEHPGVRVEWVTIDGIRKRALVEPAPERIRFGLTVDPGQPVLRFAIGLNPEAGQMTANGGARFSVEVKTEGATDVVYNRKVDAAEKRSEGRWIEDAVDLSRFAGQDIKLAFVTRPLQGEANEAPVWGDIRFTEAAPESVSQYELVYSDEVQIFENKLAMPRTFLVGDVRSVAGMDEAIAVMKAGGIDPRQTAVVEQGPAGSVPAVAPGGGTAAIETYEPQHVAIEVDAKSPSLLVLTDSLYPGWRAMIDGQKAPIYATDLAFRGVFVPAGQHRVEFAYEPMSFRIGLVIAAVGLVALLSVLVGLSRPWRNVVRNPALGAAR